MAKRPGAACDSRRNGLRFDTAILLDRYGMASLLEILTKLAEGGAVDAEASQVKRAFGQLWENLDKATEIAATLEQLGALKMEPRR